MHNIPNSASSNTNNTKFKNSRFHLDSQTFYSSKIFTNEIIFFTTHVTHPKMIISLGIDVDKYSYMRSISSTHFISQNGVHAAPSLDCLLHPARVVHLKILVNTSPMSRAEPSPILPARIEPSPSSPVSCWAHNCSPAESVSIQPWFIVLLIFGYRSLGQKRDVLGLIK